MHQIPFEQIEQFLLKSFERAELEKTCTRQVVTALIETSLRGVDSHGIRLAPHYVDSLQAGRLNGSPNIQFTKTAAATGILDADHTLGHVAGYAAMNHAIELAKDAGMGFVVVQNSSHGGALAPYTLIPPQHDMIGMGATNASPSVNVPNSTQKYYGTNPISFTAPMQDEAPFCYDGATTVYTFNKVYMFRDHDEALPEGIGVDENGVPTTNPHTVRQLLPIGSHKGFGLMMVIDMLSAMLAGMPSGGEVTSMFSMPLTEKRYLSQFFAAIRIDAFLDVAAFKTELQRHAEKIRSMPRRDPDIPVYIPGDPEKLIEAERRANGIPVTDGQLASFNAMAEKLGIAPLI